MKQFKRDNRQNSNKIHLDKYYTPTPVALRCIRKTMDLIGADNITEVIEPSAGSGAFSKLIKNCIAYDLEPEGENITKADFLSLNLEYKKGRLFIGNPPFGARNTLAVKFFKKCIESGDFIAFILPISQLNNTQQMYEFDLIHSEDIGRIKFTDRKIHCCFNIYKRPNGELNKKQKTKLNYVDITEIRLGNKSCDGCDIKICAWGSSIGKEIKDGDFFAKEFHIKISENKRKECIKLLKEADWESIYPMTSTPNLLQWQVIKYLSDNIDSTNVLLEKDHE